MYNLRIAIGGRNPRGQVGDGMWAAAYQEAEGHWKKTLAKVVFRDLQINQLSLHRGAHSRCWVNTLRKKERAGIMY